MTDENTPHADETSPDATPASGEGEAVTSNEGTPHAETAHKVGESAETESTHSGDSEKTSETDVTSEENPKPAGKKPRKSAKTTASEDTPTASTDGAAASGTGPVESSGDHGKKWYVVKVQSGREDSIKGAIERKVKIEGLEEFFGQIAIPVEEIIQKKSVRVTDKKTGDKVTQEKKVIKYQKKFPGYIFAEVEFNDRILYLFRETSGVGDFVGASLKRDPTPMTDREVRSMLTGVVEGDPGKPNQKQKVKLDYEKGDKVKIRDGAFANMEGVVKSISETKETGETPKVEVVVTIFGRPVEVILDYWHVDKA